MKTKHNYKYIYKNMLYEKHAMMEFTCVIFIADIFFADPFFHILFHSF